MRGEDDNRSRGQWQATDHVTVEIQADDDVTLVSSIREKMETIVTSPSICRVSEKLCTENNKAYFPDKVSIGPFHHDEAALKAMEDHKWRYLYALLNRKPNLEASLETCVKALRDSERRARICYKEKINFTSDEFVQMMLVDGCFIIELFLKYSMKNLRRRSDPIFSAQGMLYDIRTNLILLENQIPLLVLQRLFSLVPIPSQCSQSLTELAFRFFKNMLPGDRQVLQEKFSQEGHHLLDLIHNCFLPKYPKLQAKNAESQKQLHCATKLKAAGIRFKKDSTESLLDLKFVNGVLDIPPLKINQNTEILLRNLIALEECYCTSTQPVTSYAFFMDSLISSVKDVKLLCGQQILTNCEDKETEVSVLFKKLCKDVALRVYYYEGLCEQVNGYRSASWRRRWQKWKRNYTRTPLAVVVFFVAVLLLVFTIVGTFFSVLSFSLHHS